MRIRALAAALLLAPGCAAPPPARPPAPAPHAPAPRAAAAATGAPPVEGVRYGPEPAIALDPLEREVLAAAADRLGHRRARPATSTALVLAARAIAQRVADGHPDPLARAPVRAALTAAGAYDPAPAVLSVERRTDEVAEAVARSLPGGNATHLGAGAVIRNGRATVVVLSSDRPARLDPFPREVAPGARAALSGVLARGLSRPRVFVTLPSGAVAEVPAGGGGARFHATVAFENPGRYAVEVLGTGAGGPRVAALLDVSAGDGPGEAPGGAGEGAPDPEDPLTAEARVVEAVNAFRRRHGLSPLTPDARLAAVARAHSAAMRDAAAVAHVVPGSGAITGRLLAGAVPFRRVYENVAQARTALAAHAATEASPAHRANLLAAGVRRVGVGIARGRLSTGDPAIYLTQLLVEPPDDGADSPLTPEARVREVLWRERTRRSAPPLTSDAALDALAGAAARAMARTGEPTAEGLAARALALPRGLAAVDVFVAGGPEDAARSRHVADARFRRVGVGTATGDSVRFGAARLFVAVLWTD